MSQNANTSLTRRRRKGRAIALPVSPPEGYRHPEHPALVWRGNNWVVEGSGERFSIVQEIEEARRGS
jgi:hypothetical protein